MIAFTHLAILLVGLGAGAVITAAHMLRREARALNRNRADLRIALNRSKATGRP